ncbi:MAG TPA: serine/threonine-protein kinase [Thermoanaerobaculia bacterium]
MNFSSPIDTRFQLRRKIGTGSFGVVYEAFDTQRNRTVALKTLARADADSVARFKREFRSLAELRHPNLAAMYELIADAEEWTLSMELVRGTDLLEHLSFAELQSSFLEQKHADVPFDPDARIAFRRRSVSEGKLSTVYLGHVRETFRQLAEGLAFLHAHGVVHRDVKPTNVLITPQGRVVLLDFGLAIDAASDPALEAGLVVGTPGYMSPEQIAMTRATPASDWYSFGVMLYQALTGRRPFVAANGAEMLEQQLRSTPVPAAVVVPGLPAELSTIADRCLERDPLHRPAEGEILAAFGSSLVQARGDIRGHARPAELIGRGRELRTLMKHVTARIAEESGVVLLHGSPGIGKSVVADQLLDEVRAKTDALILGGRCHGWESLPFNAIDVIVDSIARAARAEPSPAIDRVLSTSVAMTRLFPTLDFPSLTSMDDVTLILPATPELTMVRAAEELHALLAALAGERPIVLFLDDAQWGDYQSAKIFLRLLGAPGPRIVLVLAYRTEDWRTSLLLQTILGSTVPRTEVQLDKLSPPMVEKLVKRARPDASRTFRDAAVREADGNAGLLEKVLQGGPLLGDAVTSRLGELSASARRVFRLLCEADGPLGEDAVERKLELFESDEPLRTLTRERLIRLRRTGDLLELDVYHPRLREVL